MSVFVVDDLDIINLLQVPPADDFNVNDILTNQFGEVLVNEDGNVLVTGE